MTVATATSGGTSVVVSESGAKGLDGTDGTDGIGFNQVRQSKLDNPLCHLFKINQLSAVSAPLNTDADVTWTRASTATYVDRYGVVKYSPSPDTENLILQSENLSTTWTNTAATITLSATASPDGTVTANRMAATGTNSSYQSISFTSGVEYTLSVFVKQATSAVDTIKLYFAGVAFPLLQRGSFSFSSKSFTNESGTNRYEVEPINDGWFRISMTATANATIADNAGLREETINTEGVFVWGAQVEASRVANGYIPTTTVAVTGTTSLTLAPDTVGREEKEGWLIEGASTNIQVRSEEFDNAAWAKTNLNTVTANATTAPDGTTTADKMIEDSAVTASHRVSDVVTHTAGTSTLSVYAKADTRDQLILSAGSTAIFAIQGAVFDLTLGTISTAPTLGAAKIEALSDGWYRCSATGTTTAAVTTSFIGMAVAGDSAYTGDNASGLYIWGAQVEALPFASSYIPTTTASVTRAGDLVSVQGENNAPKGDDAYAVSLKFSALGFYQTEIFTVTDASANYYDIRLINNGAIYYRSNPQGIVIIGGNYGANTQHDLIIQSSSAVYDLYFDAVLDGGSGAAVTSSPTSIPTTVDFDGAFVHLKDLRIYDFALNADEAQYLAD